MKNVKCSLKRKFYDSYQFNAFHIYATNKSNNITQTHKFPQKSSTKIDIHTTITTDPMIVIGPTIDII